jgi:hypothetical protein
MTEAVDAGMTQKRAGLCASCVHARNVESSRGSFFLLCELSRTDPTFAKYPRLPVLSCRGYEKTAPKTDPP